MNSDDGLTNCYSNHIRPNDDFLLLLNLIEEKTNESLYRLKNRNSFFEDIVSYMDKFKNEDLTNFTENKENICPNSTINTTDFKNIKRKKIKSEIVENFLCPYLKNQLESYDKFHENLIQNIDAENNEENEIFRIYRTTFNVSDILFNSKSNSCSTDVETENDKKIDNRDFNYNYSNTNFFPTNLTSLTENEHNSTSYNNQISTTNNTLTSINLVDINKNYNKNTEDLKRGIDITFSENTKFSYDNNNNYNDYYNQSRSNSVQQVKNNSQFAASYKSPSPQNQFKSKWK